MDVGRKVGIAIALAGAFTLGAVLARAVARGDVWIALVVAALGCFLMSFVHYVAGRHELARHARYRSALDALRRAAGAYRSSARPRADLEPPTELERDLGAWETWLRRVVAPISPVGIAFLLLVGFWLSVIPFVR